MDSPDTNIGKRGDSSDSLLTSYVGGEEARRDLEGGGESWDELNEYRESFQCYETGRKERDKKNRKRVIVDGFVRYADKPFIRHRPRPPSAEYRAFLIELERAKALRALFEL